MKSVVMIGPSPLSRGGMASVIALLLRHGYCDNPRCRFIASQVDGSTLRKACRAGAACCQFIGLLLAGRVGLLHVHVASGMSFWRKSVFISLALMFGVPVLFHLHGGEFIDFVERRLSGWRRSLACGLVARCAGALALTAESAHWLRQRCRLAKVDVFPNPIDCAAAMPRTPAREVLFIGRLERKKGVFDLLDSFPAVLLTHPTARLILAGEGNKDAVLAHARHLGIADRIVLPGWVGDIERAALLARAAVFVLPSWHEQMPIVVLEAMAAGTPVVATAVGAIPEMLLYGGVGKLVPARDSAKLASAILCIMDDNILADMYSVSGLARARSEYMVEVVLQRLQRRYEELAA
ncbi:MAG: glycosyltransferase [Pseudomonadota bacterium]